MATLNNFITKLRAKTATRVFKIERLDNNENVIDELTSKVISGDINLTDELGTRRTATITFDNSNGDFIPDSGGSIWMSKKFKISSGLKMDDDTEYYVSRGIFLCSEPEIVSDYNAEATASIQFLDKWSLLNGTLGGTLENTYIIPVNSNIDSAVRQLLIDAGEVKTPIIDITSEKTPYTLTVNAGESYSTILQRLAEMISWTVYFDSDGYLRFEPPSSISTTGSSWDFSTSEITYLASRHRYEFVNVYNAVTVIGSNINGSIVRATATDTNSSSPTRIALIGRKAKVIEDDLISTTPLAQQRADAELQAAISLVEVTDIDTMPIDILEGGQIITVDDDASGMNETRFLIKSISFPLNVDSNMTMNCWKGRTLT